MDLRAWGLKETNLGIAVLNYSSIVMSRMVLFHGNFDLVLCWLLDH